MSESFLSLAYDRGCLNRALSAMTRCAYLADDLLEMFDAVHTVSGSVHNWCNDRYRWHHAVATVRLTLRTNASVAAELRLR